MDKLILKITPAIIDSHKIELQLADGKHLIVHPHILVRRKQGGEVLKTMLDNGDCLDIPVEKIRGVSVLNDTFAIDTNCLNFDYDEYELVFPRRGDWFELKSQDWA